MTTATTPSPGLSMSLETPGGALSAVDAPTTMRSVINKIPPELLQLILEHTVMAVFYRFWDGADAHCVGGTPGELWLVPVRLAAVCRDWRRIALATPFLWSRIVIIMASEFEARLDQYAAALQLQLDRAGAQPMRLLLVVDFETPFPDDPGFDIELFINVVKRVVRTSVQATVMYIRSTNAEPLPKDAARLRSLFETDAGALKRMIVAMISEETDPIYVPPELIDMPFAQSVAGINSLDLAGVIPRIPDDMILLGLEELEIDVDELPTGLIARLLRACPQLQRLTLMTCSIEGTHMVPLSHATLAVLHIQVKQLDQEAALLAFCFPALKHAEIYFGVLPDSEEIPSTHKRELVRSICRGAYKLEHLAIRYAEADEQLASALFVVGLQQLKTLELEGWMLNASFWDCLAMNAGAFPCLVEIRCSEMVRSSDGRDAEVR